MKYERWPGIEFIVSEWVYRQRVTLIIQASVRAIEFTRDRRPVTREIREFITVQSADVHQLDDCAQTDEVDRKVRYVNNLRVIQEVMEI